jgi:hypothetical protein
MKALLFSLILSLGVLGLSFAGPERPVRSSTFAVKSPSGPMWDTWAAQGQWFLNPLNGMTNAMPWEFHDDDPFQVKGFSIQGVVQSITFDGTPASNIVAFTVQATVINNLGMITQQMSSSNSHNEVQSPLLPYPSYSGTMEDTRIVAEFAVASMAMLPSGTVPYYNDPVSPPPNGYFIEAVNEHELAWYCWAPNDPQGRQVGNFQVPTWKLGTIKPGASASVQMLFQISGGVMPITDYRHSVIRYSQMNQADIFYARHPSLKISHWLDTLLVDNYGGLGWIMAPPGQYKPEPPEYEYASDVSVFFDEEALDFGDAPDPSYKTLLASNGARHIIVPGVCMGTLIDAEPDGQPNANATGDDVTNFDEDGVVFTSPLIPGLMASVNVTCSVAGSLSAWIDFDFNGSWGDSGEQIFNMKSVSAGTNALPFTVSPTAGIGSTFARFRFTTYQASQMSYTNLVNDGEVEDYKVLVEEAEIDFGDAPDTPSTLRYPTLLVHNGARHTIIPGVFLGALIDAEPDGQPDGTSTGDDNNLPDDEDGVSIPRPLIAGATVNVQVTASASGFLNAWIDWNNNQSWIDPGDQVYTNVMLNPGSNNLLLNVPLPPAIVSGGPHSRWRFTTYPVGTPSYVGREADGEVEDYEVTLQILDFGDAPDPRYPTLLASYGACHLIPSSYYLGTVPPDLEPDGQSDPLAMGDDTNGTADEDGVTYSGSLIRGSNTTFTIVASTNGWLNAWIDFDQNRSWGDLGEQIATNVALVSGMNTLVVSVPALAAWGTTFGRFRFSSYRGLLPTGSAYDGEVEDYAFTLYQQKPTTSLAITNITCNASNTVATIKWNGESPLVYETQYADVLSTSMTWTVWGPYVGSAPYEQTNSISGVTSRFYRVSVPYTAP